VEVEKLKYVTLPESKLSARKTSIYIYTLVYKELCKIAAESLSGDKAAGVWN